MTCLRIETRPKHVVLPFRLQPIGSWPKKKRKRTVASFLHLKNLNGTRSVALHELEVKPLKQPAFHGPMAPWTCGENPAAGAPDVFFFPGARPQAVEMDPEVMYMR